jgi:hypothetical protein
VSLPYVALNSDAAFYDPTFYPPYWPSVKTLQNGLCLIVMQPGKDDPTMGALANCDGYATDVFPVRDEDDPLVSQAREVVRIRTLAKRDVKQIALSKALIQPRAKYLQNYAARTICREFTSVDPQWSFTTLSTACATQLAHTFEAPTCIEIEQSLASTYPKVQRSSGTDKLYLQALAMLVLAETKHSLASFAARVSFISPSVSPNELWDADTIGRLNDRLLNADPKDVDSHAKQIALQWLNRSSLVP